MLDQSEVTSRSAVVSQLLILTGCLFIGLFLIGPLLAFLAILPFYDNLTFAGMTNFISNPPNNTEGRMLILALQGITALIGFILVPWAYLRWFEHKSIASLNERKTSLIPLILALVIVLVVMPFMSSVIHWNANLELPAFLSEFEQAAKAKEEQLAKLTAFLTNIGSLPELLIATFIIALLPGIGEELIFRGLIQKKFSYLMSPHLAIWLSAFLFSALHLQFYGLVPRMLLGVLFGYIYYWSGNLWLPVLAHFLNNAFTLLMIYLYKQKVVSFDIQTINYSTLWVVLSLIGSAALLWLLYTQTLKVPSTQNQEDIHYAGENN
ncbi:CPBP family intramembrane glutamic endopeptidase [uncultured Microscilla sp.]|uniref:CPBP family intramembrane glutamic endopeptidase n=1 Tax=uncultured Microscilla sp. TaxID=432653 RepID=UPI0026137CE6|nr:CPBP family intramembrane glutamic endopeptidase [uncultured Microscilla sp.]